jgi:protein O-mannosyl-transferase
MPAPQAINMSRLRKLPLPALVLVLLTAALYWPTTRHGFMVVDDNEYVYDNPWVTGGMSWSAIRWAFTTYHSANWHPLTWLSHQADWSLYGAFAGGHHLTNVLLHAINTLFLFLLLRKLTGSVWRSWVVAALFGWHPLHVESVAWISERKDLLSTLCLLGCIWAYGRYAKSGERSATVQYIYYALALLIFAAGLMCKPMIVTLPFLLLLLDFWPLGRIADRGSPMAELKSKTFREVSLKKAIVEKIPFFALSAGACLVTLAVQRASGAVKGTNEESLALRVLNALSACGVYLRETFWPNPLCIYYPMPREYPWAGAIMGALLLGGVTLLAIWQRKKWPWFLVGWLWLIGSLVPVIGLVQVGHQSHADRYMYIPSIGLFIGLVWGAWHWMENLASRKQLATGLAGACLAICLALTWQQEGLWTDDITLFRYAAAHNPPSYFVENNLAVSLSAAGQSKEALAHFREAVRLDPRNPILYQNVGIELANLGDLEGARQSFEQAVSLRPHSQVLLNNLGGILAQQQKYTEALQKFHEAIRWDPSYPNSYANAGSVCQALGDAGAAATNYSTALRLQPDLLAALEHFSYLLATCPAPACHNPEMAVQLAQRSVQITQGSSAEQLKTLAIACASAGQYSNAVTAGESALKILQGRGTPEALAQIQGQLAAYRAGRNPQWDWKRLP